MRNLLPDSSVSAAMTILGRRLEPSWVSSSWIQNRGHAVRPPSRYCDLPGNQNKSRLALACVLTQNGLRTLLRHGDRNSMAFSIESCVPFLTTQITHYVLRLPEQYLVDRSGRSKAVFRAAMKGIVPDFILERRDKIGFQTPQESWLNNLSDWVSDVLETAEEIPFLTVDELRSHWYSMMQSGHVRSANVWRWINFLRWVSLFRVRT